MAMLDCFRPSDSAEAHINIKVGCCNKKIKKILTKQTSVILLNILQMNDDDFNEVLKNLSQLHDLQKVNSH